MDSPQTPVVGRLRFLLFGVKYRRSCGWGRSRHPSQQPLEVMYTKASPQSFLCLPLTASSSSLPPGRKPCLACYHVKIAIVAFPKASIILLVSNLVHVVGAVVQHMEDDRSRIVETDGLTETETYCLQSRGHNERVAILPSSLVVVNF